MGCCVSTNGNSRKDENLQVGSEKSLKMKPKLSSIQESRAPPPSAEEETVKEVLSETPQFKLPILNNSFQPQEPQQLNKKKIHIDQKPFLDDEKIKNRMPFYQDYISEQEVSEVCSLSMSETVSTTTYKKGDDYDDDAGDDDDDEEEVKQRVIVKRSPVSRLPRNQAVSGDFGPRKDRVVGKSPTRRTEQSPDKRNNAVGRGGGAVRLVQSKESGNYQAGRRGLRSDPNRKDPGEASARRSRSPATNSNRSMMMTQSPSIRRTTGSPGRFKTDPVENGGRVEKGTEEKWPSTSTNVDDTTTVNESLENPLVSLECFIFL